jgi:hypothetical protein
VIGIRIRMRLGSWWFTPTRCVFHSVVWVFRPGTRLVQVEQIFQCLPALDVWLSFVEPNVLARFAQMSTGRSSTAVSRWRLRFSGSVGARLG